MDNDSDQQGLSLVEELKADFPWPIWAGFEEQRGISFARNALVSKAKDFDYIAFIDDDETADSHWLENLLRTAQTTGAEAVLGPVGVNFETDPSPTMRALLARPDLEDGATVPAGYFRTGNLLLRTAVLAAIPGPFDPAFAITGGSDHMLGQQLLAKGCRFVWAANAEVHETVPASRATFRWYLQRRYRTGVTYSKTQRVVRGSIRGSLRGAYRGVGSLAAGMFDLAQSLPNKRDHAAKAAGLLMYGLGSLTGALGVRYEEYRKTHGD